MKTTSPVGPDVLPKTTKKTEMTLWGNTYNTGNRRRRSHQIQSRRHRCSDRWLHGVLERFEEGHRVGLGSYGAFFSPYTWIGVFKEISLHAANNKDLKKVPLFIWLLHVFAPFILLTLVIGNTSTPIDGYRNTIISSLKTASTVALLSPLSIGTVLRIPEVTTFVPRMVAFKSLRIEADDDAKQSLSQAIERGDALRCGRFDVFFPPTNHHHRRRRCHRTVVRRRDGCSRGDRFYTGKKRKSLVFIPGAFVDHTAYSTVAARLAREGDMIVAVMSLEPFRLAAENLGADLCDVVRVMKYTARLWKREYRRRCREEFEDGSRVSPEERFCCEEEDGLDWCLGGHSYGGYTALRLAPQLDRYLKDERCTLSPSGEKLGVGKNVQSRLQVIAWAVGLQSVTATITNLSDVVDIDVLVVNGSNDNMVGLKTKEVQKELRSKLPSTKKTKCVIVSGGTHNNFASYTAPKQFMKIFMQLNGTPGLSKNEQHRRVCSETLQFLSSQ